MLEEMNLATSWNIKEIGNIIQIEKTFVAKDFKRAMQYLNKVADLAESIGVKNLILNFNLTILSSIILIWSFANIEL